LSTKIKGYKVYNPISFIIYIWKLIKLSKSLIAYINNTKIAIIHGNSFAGTLYGSIASKKSNIPFIPHLRELPRIGYFSGKIFTFIIYNIAIRPSVVSIAISNLVHDAYTNNLSNNSAPIFTLNDPVDTENFSPNRNYENIRKKYRLKGDDFVVGLFGRFEDWKGHIVAIKALSIVKKHTNKCIKLVFVGDYNGAHISYMKNIKQLILNSNLTKDVIMVGLQKNMPLYYNMVDVIIVPSISEPLGRVVMEGMAMRKPVIATNVGGPAEIITDSIDGYLINPNNPRDLSDKIIYLINGGLKVDLVILARKKIIKNHSISNYVSKIMRLYNNVLRASN